MGDKIHDVGAKYALKSVDDLSRIFNHRLREKSRKVEFKNTSGRNWRRIDFHASQLRVVYDLFDDNIEV